MPFSPFEEIDPSKKDLSKNSISYFSELIKRGSKIGIDKFVVHPSGEPIDEGERAERMRCARESLALLAEIAAENSAVIAVENLPRTCLGKNSDEILQLISLNDKLRVCFDTNHLLAEKPMDFIRKTGEKIITVHISDYDFVNERHWLPGEGKLCWQEILAALKNADYRGVWLYEIGFKAPASIIRSRDLACEDFAANANEIFTNEKIIVHGKPNIN